MTPSWQPQRARLGDGRWHYQHGPIDLVIGADGEPAACDAAHQACWQAFQSVLAELVSELSALRQALPRSGAAASVSGPVARRMVGACLPHAHDGLFITPMAAVAGSVADHLIDAYRRAGVLRAYINNGGDIALHLAPGQHWRAGVVANIDDPSLDASLVVTGESGLRGLATSGWRGRSLSLGIADSVTVVARDAAAADAAATIIANHVNVTDPAIRRLPANQVRDDSDLGTLPVTVAVGALPSASIEQALASGLACAQQLVERGLISQALLNLAGRWVQAGSGCVLPAFAGQPNRSRLLEVAG
ncbi:MAG: UPF0280 family protein [Betaproteobacteria bacterium]|nr:UPF0280 family protein [Betaproteobacteria bacterium]